MATTKQKTKLTGEQITAFKCDIPTSEYIENDAYYAGRNTAILKQEKKKDPDNRVPVAYVNRLIKNLLGFAARSGDISTEITVTDETKDLDEKIKKTFEKIEANNHTDILNSKLYKGTAKDGISYDIVYTETDKDGNSLLKVADLKPINCYPIWDEALSTVKKLDKLVRYYDRVEPITIDTEDGQEIILESGNYANVYMAGGFEIWHEELVEVDETKPVNLEKRENCEDRFIFKVFIDQPFDEIQVTPYPANDEQIPYWLPVKNIIDQYDKIISGQVNESDRFNESWLMFWNKVSPEIKKTIDEMAIIDNVKNGFQEGFSDIFPRFLERNVPTDHARLMLETLESLIYTLIGVPSFLDESFGASSGVALLFRLIGLEYAAVEIDTYFDLGIMNRVSLIKQALSSDLEFQNVEDFKKEDLENVEANVKHRRNIPMDLSTIIEQALSMKALGLSIDTILKYLPRDIVQSVEDELKKIEEQSEKNKITFEDSKDEDANNS